MISPEGKILSFNPQFVKMWMIPQEVIDSRSDEQALNAIFSLLQNPDEFLAKVNYFYQHPDETGRDEIYLKDGRVFERHTRPLAGLDGKYYGRLWNFRDITEQVEAGNEVDSLLKFAAEAIGVVNTQTGLFESVNEAAQKLYGLSREQLVKVGPAQLSPEFQPDGRPSLEKAMEKLGEALKGGRPVFEWMHINSAGESIPCEVRLVGMTGAQNHKVRFSATDITNRKRAEETLLANQGFLQTVMDNIPESIFWKNESLTYLGCNRAFAKDAGLASPAEIIGKTDWDMPWKDQAELYRADDRLVMDRQEPKLNYEEPQTTPDGSTTWLRTSKVPLKDASGKVYAVFGMYEDITERKRVEENLLRLQSAVEQTEEGIALADLNGNLIYSNPAWAKMHGYTTEEIPGNYLSIFHTQEQLEKEVMPFNKKVMSNGSNTAEVGHVRKDGTAFPTLMSVTVQKDQNGAPVGMIGTARDITDFKRIEQSLHESEARYSAVVKQASDGIILIQDNVIKFANQALASMLGYDRPEEIENTPIIKYIAAESQALVVARIKARLAGEEVPDLYETRLLRKDGTTFDAELSAGITELNGEPADVGLIRDITERKRMEIVLRDSQEFLQTIMDNIPESIFWKDENLTYLGCNRAFADDAGLASPSDIVGKTDWDMPWKEQAELYRADDRLVMEQRNAKLNYEEPQTTPDGYTTWLRTSKIPLVNTSGKVYAVLGMYEDITDRKRAEQVVFESQARFQGLVETLSDWIWEVNPNGAYTYISPKVKDMLGYEPEELLGKTPFDLMPAEEAQRVAGVFGPLLSAQKPLVSLENVNLHKDGHPVVLETSGVPFYDAQGQFRGYRGTDRDVTERKRLEQQIRAALERRGYQVRVSTQISQQIASATDLNELYKIAVKLVKEELGYYHVQLLRYDPTVNEVALIEGYGEMGARMKSMRHRMPMGIGLIGTAAETGQVMLRPNLKNDPDWKPNPLLPETRGEIAVPIKLGDEVLGVLDVQSSAEDALGADDQLLLEGLCGQIAIAIEGTRLRSSLNDQLLELNALQRASSREGWQVLAQAKDVTAYVYEEASVRPLAEAETALSSAGVQAAIAPITIRDEVIGALGVYEDDGKPLSPEEQELLESISGQVAQALEAARLFEQTQRRAAELQTVATVSTVTSTMLDPDALLQTVVDLTRERFALYHAHIYVVDEAWKTLLLAAGAGEVGKQMVADGWNIPLDHPSSIVATAAREKTSVIASDVRHSTDSPFLSNRLLPDTRSEMAVPMIAGDKVLGVFDVQSSMSGYFSEEDAKIYTTLAAQVAIALQNARLYMEQAATLTQLRELDRLKSSFLANMSHELRTPLNSILGFADVMLEELDGPLTENMQTDLALIQKNGKHLLHLINDVLDMAKIEAGKMNLSLERFNVQDILEDVTSITQPLANSKSLAVFIEADSDRNVDITADRTRIRQVMLNIVNNAIKFTEAGWVSIHAGRNDDRVLICVRDTGISIPPENLETIFQEFTQVDTSSTRKTGGTGLGLPISRRLVEMHGGRLWAESSGVEGEGSTFFVELPIEARLAEPVEKTEK
ncbi:MAG: PAS domain S-box protein [Chloroflexi bacterium]|nr:PAS domain S-box protein [Chloroflexota bacterium]